MHRDPNISVLSSLHREPKWPDGRDYALKGSDFGQIQALVPPDVVLLASPVENWLSQIDPSEQILVRNAVRRRQAEFSTGRLLASMALEALGVPPKAISRGPMNEPVWPEGVVGSITHTSEFCMVAVAASGNIAGLGIDLESRRAEIREVEHMILRPDERNFCIGRGTSRLDAVRLIFSAKESLYKAVYARAGRFIDFLEVRIEVQEEARSFIATAPGDAKLDALLRQGAGRFVTTPNFVFAIWC